MTIHLENHCENQVTYFLETQVYLLKLFIFSAAGVAKAAELCELVIEIDPDNEIGLLLLAANLSSRGLYSRAEYF